MRVEALFDWIQKRYAITQAKNAGAPKPWTPDPILQTYRFCNVHREDDKVTKWVANNWRKPNAKDPHLWFAMVVARFINWPSTLEELGYPSQSTYCSFASNFKSVILDRERRKEQVYGGAYTISTNGRAMVKWQYLEEQVFAPLWDNRAAVEACIAYKGEALGGLHGVLLNFQGMGSFMAAQVIADLKYAQMTKAPDWWTWAASGPGSRRGLNRVQCPTMQEGGERKNTPWKEEVWLARLQELQAQIDPLVAKAGIPRLHAQDLQNCLCELDKIERVKLGEGRPRSLYSGR